MARAIRVLGVERDPTSRLGLEQLLKREGFEPVSASNTADAMPLLAGVGTLLLDPILPKGFGGSILTHIGVISSIPPSDPRMTGLKFDAFFEKPITRDKLDSLLAWLKALPPAAATP